ncbi:PilZ domain-containing protein [Marinagarivorans algicola]|uniref:PilZ domain-containing protein n=1 Tax=Marinagarivorans algicola TaxID=1513270 RepID=UPI0006B51FD4|nr:PilZ domain-containing protein [Marinagarivorans algicola]
MATVKRPNVSVQASEAWLAYSCRWVEDLATEVCHFEGFIKHPRDIPLDFTIDNPPAYVAANKLKVHEGGMVFESSASLPVGVRIHLTVNLKGNHFILTGIVAHCIDIDGARYHIGVQFEQDNEHHSMRMIEQACHIEHYRKQACQYGRPITEDEAAREWISRFAAHFPR